ncbi:hypothetical protein Tco_0249194, partial [Tanacetum coccineum]
PLSAWSRETFDRIGKKWGETLDLEDNADTSFGRKRLCVKTKHLVSVLETNMSPCLSHPPGFTLEDSEKRDEGVTDIGDNNNNVIKEAPVGFSANVMNTSQDVPVEAHNDSVGLNVVQNRGSVLGVMEDIIRVGQAMGYTIEGSVKDLENIIG